MGKRRSKIGAPNRSQTHELSPEEERRSAERAKARRKASKVMVSKRKKPKMKGKLRGTGAHRSTGTAYRPMLKGTVVLTGGKK